MATVIGNVEHASFQEYYNLYRLDCRKYKTKIFKTSEYHEKRLEKVIEYIEQSFKIMYPSFYQHIIDEIPSIKWRLEKHHHQKLEEIQSLIKSSKFKFEKAVSIALPFAIEKKLSAYDIVGRVDCLYHAPDGSIIPEDLKSHSSRFDSLIHQESHKTQLCAYAVLIEAVYKKPVNAARIFYTKDLTYENFEITKNDKVQVLKMKDELQNILDRGLPPIIDDPLKCQYCYKQNLCKKIAEMGTSDPTEYIALDGEVN